MKIKNKINISFVVTFVFVAFISTVLVGIFTVNVIKKNINSSLQSSNRARAEHIRTFIQDQEKTSVILAAGVVYREILKEPKNSIQYSIIKNKADARMIRNIESDPNIYESFIVDKNGMIVVSSDRTQEGTDKSKDEYFVNAKTNFYFKDIYFSDSVKKINYTTSAPVLDNNGDFLGVSVLRYLPKNFFSIVNNENGLGDTEENFLVSKNNIMISPSRFSGEDAVLKQKVKTQNTDKCFDPKEVEYVKKNGYSGLIQTLGSQVLDFKDYRNVQVLGTHSYIPETGWCLITKADKSDLFSFQNDLIILLAVISFFALLFLIFIGTMVSMKITNPIYRLIKGIKIIEKGDLNYKIDIKTNDEIGILSNAFGKLIEVIKKERSNIEEKVEVQTKEIITKANDLENQKSAILNILEDVEKEKNKTEQLAQDLEKFKLAVDCASDQVVIADIEGIVVYGNKAVERITGFKPEEALGKKAGVLWKTPMPNEYYENLWKTIKIEKKVFISEIQNKRKNGELYIANISISPVLDDENKVIYFVAIEHDITKEKEIDKAKTEFVSLASHQLRTPLSAINWYTEMLLAGDAGKINEEQKKYLNEVAIGNKRMVDLVDALLNVSRLDLGTFIIEPEEVNVVEMAKSVVGELQPQIKEKKLKIEEDYVETVPQFKADKKLLRMILQNLLSNAVKYTSKGSVKIKINIVKKDEVFGEKKIEEDSLCFSVSDSGMGITASQQEKIFTKLFRADNARESETEGTGLGLYIIKSIVDQSGGLVWFKSEEGKGTTFYLSFNLDGMKKKEGTRKLD